MTVYRFALGLFGLQIDFIIDYCGPSIGCMQPLVLYFPCYIKYASFHRMRLGPGHESFMATNMATRVRSKSWNFLEEKYFEKA